MTGAVITVSMPEGLLPRRTLESVFCSPVRGKEEVSSKCSMKNLDEAGIRTFHFS